MIERCIGANVGQGRALARCQALHCAHLRLWEDRCPEALLFLKNSYLAQGCHHVTVTCITEDPVRRNHLPLLTRISAFSEAEDKPHTVAGHDIELENLGLPQVRRLLSVLRVVVCLDSGTDLNDGRSFHAPLFPSHTLATLLEKLLQATHVPHESLELVQRHFAVVVQIHDAGFFLTPSNVRAHELELLGVQVPGSVVVKAAKRIADLRKLVFQAAVDPVQATLCFVSLLRERELPATPHPVEKRMRSKFRSHRFQVRVLLCQPRKGRNDAC
mmetsp:Transcript_9095/g.21587  ORF Transcript_9095/g.21587 Transcript_9095/m.21587 type:complete len:272 (-) Transcript_9095:46-861(-)